VKETLGLATHIKEAIEIWGTPYRYFTPVVTGFGTVSQAVKDRPLRIRLFMV